MRVLAIETSCDETSAAVIEKKGANQIEILLNITASSSSLHAKTGGIIPESAAREQVRWIVPVIIDALLASTNNETIEQLSNEEKFRISQHILTDKIDAIAVTHGPGLIGSLLVGVETAKTLAFALNKPLTPINHLLGHLYANFIHPLSLRANESSRGNLKMNKIASSPAQRDPRNDTVEFPFIGLIVSGGHTDLLLFKSHSKFKWLGGTRDDAAGEALDKIGRLLGLFYPAGPEIESRAARVKKTSLKFHSPLLNEETFDFSFSGLKTEVLRFVQREKHLRGIRADSSDGGIDKELKNEICFATQKAVIDVLVDKTLKAAQKYKVKSILLGGGVAANQTLRNQFEQMTKDQRLKTKIFAPAKIFCTDNAAMIGAYALLNYKPIDWRNVEAEPELYFG